MMNVNWFGVALITGLSYFVIWVEFNFGQI